MPKLSIITVNLNNAEGLKKTIESVINQTFTDYEYIIIDGGSSDGSVDIIKQYADKITFWVSEPDKGIYNAMNKGAKLATGEWLYFINSDDILMPNVLNKIFSEKLNFDFIYGNVKKVPSSIIYAGFFDIEKLLYQNICHQSIFIKKRTLEKLGFYNEKYKIGADYAINIKIFNGNYKIKYIPLIIAEYNEKGISSSHFDNVFFYDIKTNFIKPFKKKITKKKLLNRIWNIFSLILESNKISFSKKILFLIKIFCFSKSIGGLILGIKKICKF